MKKRLLCLAMTLALIVCLFPTALAATGNDAMYYERQLATDNARAIYNKLEAMLTSGQLADGVTVDLVADGVLENQHYTQSALMVDFSAARDAFMLDHNVFYVNFDKLSVTLLQTGSNYAVTMGIGRDATYLADGFTVDTVDAGITAFNAAVKAIADTAGAMKNLDEQVRAAFEGVMDSTTYALEKDAEPENVPYVRSPYGALVTGEAVCEGYARALKAVLDALGIENVLVQGVYVDDTKPEPHMWNYVRMDDNRWYMLDATMADGWKAGEVSAAADSFFLVTGLDEVMDDYQPSGVVSTLSGNQSGDGETTSQVSFEFGYPDLSIKEYERLSNAFKVVGKDAEYRYYDMISYNDMGVTAAQKTTMTDESGEEKPIYILCSQNGTIWYYYERYFQVMGASSYWSGTPVTEIKMTDLGFDSQASFVNLFSTAMFAVTTIAPTVEYDTQWTTPVQMQQYYVYEGGLQNVHDVSLVGTATDFAKKPPYITEKIPYNSRLDQGKTYEVSVTYSEPLKKANSAMDVSMSWVREVNGGSFTNFAWDGSNTVTFTLTTGVNFGNTTNYYFELQNLIGKDSGKAPNAIGFSTYNNNVFDCPKVDWDVSKIHSNTPALIANDDLSTDGWTDAEGNSLANLPKRLALVATTIEDKVDNEGNPVNDKQDMIDDIEEIFEENVLSAQTYDISLSLCSGQVDYITGKPVQVFVPYPAGYSYESLGNTSFKAYHFDKNGTPEEIDCVAVQGGIIMMCKAFSPFAVVATARTEAAEKLVMLNASKGGSITGGTDGLLKVTADTTVTVTAAAGYRLDSLTLNGTAITADENGMVKLSYASLEDSGNVLEASFVLTFLSVGGDPGVTVDQNNVTIVTADAKTTVTVPVKLENAALKSYSLILDLYEDGRMTGLRMVRVDATTTSLSAECSGVPDFARLFFVDGGVWTPVSGACDIPIPQN